MLSRINADYDECSVGRVRIRVWSWIINTFMRTIRAGIGISGRIRARLRLMISRGGSGRIRARLRLMIRLFGLCLGLSDSRSIGRLGFGRCTEE